jgi:hypothetical protein
MPLPRYNSHLEPDFVPVPFVTLAEYQRGRQWQLRAGPESRFYSRDRMMRRNSIM